MVHEKGDIAELTDEIAAKIDPKFIEAVSEETAQTIIAEQSAVVEEPVEAAATVKPKRVRKKKPVEAEPIAEETVKPPNTPDS